MDFPPEKRERFRADVQSILELQPKRRSSSRILEKRMRALSWRGWANYGAFVQLCRDAGFFAYDGIGRLNKPTHFVAMDPPSQEPDYFRGVGYVIAVSEGLWVNRSRPARTTKVRASARVWATRGGVLGYCERLGHSNDCIQDTRDLDNGPA